MKTKTSYDYQFISTDGKQHYTREFNSHLEAVEFSDKKFYGNNVNSRFHKVIVTVI
jgi:hypothetical protein